MELKINSHLKKNSLSYSIDYFFQKLKTENLSYLDSQAIIFFLQANNQKKHVYNWLLQKLKSNSKFSFSHLFWLLANQVDPVMEKSILTGLHNTKADCSDFNPNINSKKIKLLIAQSLNKKALKRQQFKEDLLEKIQHCALNNLQEQYSQNINKLKFEFTQDNDSKINQIIEDFEQQKLENILISTIQKYKNKKLEIKKKSLNLEPLYKQCLIQSSISLSKENPQLSYDLSILAQNLELNELSENLLSNISTQNDSIIWLRAHNFIQSNKFLEALNLIDSNVDSINAKYLLDYEYLKVFAWKGLNETKKAIKTLEEILAVKKNYRNASILKQLYLKEL